MLSTNINCGLAVLLNSSFPRSAPGVHSSCIGKIIFSTLRADFFLNCWLLLYYNDPWFRFRAILLRTAIFVFFLRNALVCTKKKKMVNNFIFLSNYMWSTIGLYYWSLIALRFDPLLIFIANLLAAWTIRIIK